MLVRWRTLMSRSLAGVMLSLLFVASAVEAEAGYLGTLLLSDLPTWPGRVVRLAQGPVTGGTWAYPTWGDINSDGHPDLVLGSAYGDVLAYPSDERGGLGPPLPLLVSDLPAVGVSLMPAVPCLTDLTLDGLPDLLLLLGDRLVLYESRASGLASGQELRNCDGRPLGQAMADVLAAGGPCGLTALRTPAVFLLSTTAGELWELQIVDRRVFVLNGPVRLGGASGRFSEAVRVALADPDADGQQELVAGGSSRVYVCETVDGGWGQPTLLGEGLRTPDGIETGVVTPAALGPGRLLLGTAWGPVAVADVRGEKLTVTEWLTASDVPLDVGLCAAPVACDWNGDRRQDLVVAGADGLLRVLMAGIDGGYDSAATVQDRDGAIRATGGELRPCFPALADLDGDGDLDLLLGQADGTVRMWRNDGVFVEVGAVVVSGMPLTGQGIAVPLPLDWDGDGDQDLFIGAKPPPEDWTGRAAATSSYPMIRYLENEARGKSLPLFGKSVLVDFLLERGEGHGDAAVLEPWQVWLGPSPRLGGEAWVLARAGLFIFTTATTGPAYPRFVLPWQGEAARPVHPRGLVWSFCPTNGPREGVFVGLAPYGFVCHALVR